MGAETARALGYEVEAEEADLDAEAADDKAGKQPVPKKKKKKKPAVESPVKAVHFSNFIVQ